MKNTLKRRSQGGLGYKMGGNRDTHTYGVCAVSRLASGHLPGHSPRSIGTRSGREAGHSRDTCSGPVPMDLSGHSQRSSGPLREAPHDAWRRTFPSHPSLASHSRECFLQAFEGAVAAVQRGRFVVIL